MKKILALALVSLLPLSASAKKETFNVVPADSKVNWEGKKIIGGAHQGELKLKSGKIMADKGAITGGEFVVDMLSLKNTDLTDEGMNKKLVGHLNSDDFFSVEKHPTASLKVNKATKKDGDNYEFAGDLTIKGIKKPITFPAVVHIDGGKVHTTGTITVDRTLYDVKYNSLKFFSAIGDKAIADTFTVSVDVTAKK